MSRLLIDLQGDWKVPALNGDEPVTSRVNFLGDTTVPSWLTTPSGTPSITGTKRLAVTTGATIGNQAQFVGPAFDTSAFVAMWLRFKSLSFSSQSVNVDVAISGSGGSGVILRQLATDATATVIIGGATYPIPYQITKNGNMAGNRRDIGLLILPKIAASGGYGFDRNAEVWVTEGRELMAGLTKRPTDGTPLPWVGGSVSPRVYATTTVASAQHFQFAEYEFSAWI
tara:strand:+ start:3039 stop:3719 length:681 start_codon:yes stop_codon:yes gene_type:complete